MQGPICGIIQQDINTKKDGNSYDVKFEINLITSDADGNDFTDAFDASNAHYEGSSDLSNTLQVGITNTKDKGVRAKGEATYGKYITLDSETFDSRTAAHEMGHILGLGEWTGGLMESGGSSTNITKGMIEGIMYNSGMMQNPGNQSSDHQLPKVGNTFDPGKINLKGINNNLKNGVVK